MATKLISGTEAIKRLTGGFRSRNTSQEEFLLQHGITPVAVVKTGKRSTCIVDAAHVDAVVAKANGAVPVVNGRRRRSQDSAILVRIESKIDQLLRALGEKV